MLKKVTISLPDQLLSEIDEAAKSEHRTRSDFIRETLCEYLSKSKENKRPIDNPRVREAYEGIRSIRLKEKFDSTEIIREMRESRHSK